MDNKIDLNAIARDKNFESGNTRHWDILRECMREAIHQALVLASEKAKFQYSHRHSTTSQKSSTPQDISDYTVWINKDSILAIGELIV
jgi:hypothetical protein